MASDEAVARVLVEGPRRVMLLGAVDVGKSTFCRALIAAALEQGRPAALVDSDVGQKMVGPPAAITCFEAGRADRLSQLAFVGTTDPVKGLAEVVCGTGELVRRCDGDLTVINTSGLLTGAGRRMKVKKIRAVGPDLIVAIGNDPALHPILSDHAGLRVVHIEQWTGARRKTDGERRAARRDAFRSYFAQARPWELAALAPEGIELVNGQLLGLRGVDGRDLAIGVAMISAPRATPRVLAPDAGRAAVTIIPGTIALDASYNAVPLPPGPGSPRAI